MVTSNKPPNAAKPAGPTSQKPKDVASPAPKSHGSNKGTNGSLKSASAGISRGPGGGISGGTRNAGSGTANGQREPWAVRKWLDQEPGEEPWNPGNRRG